MQKIPPYFPSRPDGFYCFKGFKLKIHRQFWTFYPLPSTFYPRPSTFYPRPSHFYPRPSTLDENLHSMRYCQNKNTNKKANRGGNQTWKKTQMLTKKTNKEDLGDVIMKLEGKHPMCLEFCIRAAVSTTRHESFRNASEVYWRKIPENTRRSLERTAKSCGSTCFRCTQNLYLQLQRTWKRTVKFIWHCGGWRL